jgi:hypothetical protein
MTSYAGPRAQEVAGFGVAGSTSDFDFADQSVRFLTGYTGALGSYAPLGETEFTLLDTLSLRACCLFRVPLSGARTPLWLAVEALKDALLRDETIPSAVTARVVSESADLPALRASLDLEWYERVKGFGAVPLATQYARIRRTRRKREAATPLDSVAGRETRESLRRF